MSGLDLSGCFKAYDVRGRVPFHLGENLRLQLETLGDAFDRKFDCLPRQRSELGVHVQIQGARFRADLLRGVRHASVHALRRRTRSHDDVHRETPGGEQRRDVDAHRARADDRDAALRCPG